MKAFIAHPLNLEITYLPDHTSKKTSVPVPSHQELFKKVRLLNGSIVKCGISRNDGFRRFSLFKNLMGSPALHKMVAFEKVQPAHANVEDTASALSTAAREKIDFIPGYWCDTIPDYLIENPEEKLALLDLDTTDYESTITALEFLYPRLVQGGLLLLDCYAPGGELPNPVNDYFAPGKVIVHNFSETQRIYYIIKE